MKLTLSSRTTPFRGTYRPAGDKSLSHRALLFSALALGRSEIHDFLLSGVTKAMLDVLSKLGICWEIDEATHTLIVEGKGLHGFSTPTEPLYCGNSATTFRLLAGALAGAGVACTLTGSEGLRKRPMRRISDPLHQMGAQIETTEGCAPLTFQPAQLHGTDYSQPVASAQVKSCLILAALSASTPSTFREPGPSRDHTERMLTSMGAKLELSPGCVKVYPQTTPLQPLHTELAGDISSATFLIVAAACIPGSEFTLTHVGINPTRTGILDALEAMGADITLSNKMEIAGEPVADICVRYAPLHGIQIQGDLVVRMIDEFPAFMVAAATAQGKTIVHDAQELRTKESDRIAIMTEEFKKQGIAIEEYDDGFAIDGTGMIPGGGQAYGHKDHRVAMSMILAALVAQQPITIEGAEILQESFPDFLNVLQIPAPTL